MGSGPGRRHILLHLFMLFPRVKKNSLRHFFMPFPRLTDSSRHSYSIFTRCLLHFFTAISMINKIFTPFLFSFYSFFLLHVFIPCPRLKYSLRHFYSIFTAFLLHVLHHFLFYIFMLFPRLMNYLRHFYSILLNL